MSKPYEFRVISPSRFVRWFREKGGDQLDWENMTVHDITTTFIVNHTHKGKRLHDQLKLTLMHGDNTRAVTILSRSSGATSEVSERENSGGMFAEAPVASTQLHGMYDFVSHRWGSPWAHLISYLMQYEIDMWLDVVSVHQLHDDGQMQGLDLSQIDRAVVCARNFRLLMDEDGKYFTRVWCLWEMGNWMLKRGPKDIRIAIPSRMNKADGDYTYFQSKTAIIKRVLEKGIDIGNASATNPSDKIIIMDWIDENLTRKKFNQLIVDALEDQIARDEKGRAYEKQIAEVQREVSAKSTSEAAISDSFKCFLL